MGRLLHTSLISRHLHYMSQLSLRVTSRGEVFTRREMEKVLIVRKEYIHSIILYQTLSYHIAAVKHVNRARIAYTSILKA